MMRNAQQTIGNLIDKQSVSFISSIDQDGFPNTKAMLSPCVRDGIRIFYYHTNTSSIRIAQYQENPKACLYFCDKRFFRGVMLKGNMEVLTDRKTKEMLWQDDYVKYYSEGVTDPDYCILKFTAQTGRYYSNFASENFTVV